MTDWEKAIAHWLPEVWTPGQVCKHQIGTHCPIEYGNPLAWKWVELYDYYSHVTHDIPCPPATPELGFQLLEAMLRKSAEAIRFEFMSELFLLDTIDGPVFDGPDLLTAIIKAAAALAEKDEQP